MLINALCPVEFNSTNKLNQTSIRSKEQGIKNICQSRRGPCCWIYRSTCRLSRSIDHIFNQDFQGLFIYIIIFWHSAVWWRWWERLWWVLVLWKKNAERELNLSKRKAVHKKCITSRHFRTWVVCMSHEKENPNDSLLFWNLLYCSLIFSFVFFCIVCFYNRNLKLT